MKRYEVVAKIDDEFQAKLLEGVLEKEEIPFRIRSYYDLAYDGLFQAQKGWGHVEAPEEYHDQILAIFDDLKQDENN